MGPEGGRRGRGPRKTIPYSLQDVDRFSILPTSPIQLILCRKRVKPKEFQSADKDQKTIFFRCKNISNYKSYLLRQNYIAVGFFVCVITSCISFTRTEKNYVKMIEDNICNRTIDFKAKNEIINMNRN